MSRETLVSELIRAQAKGLKMPGLARVFEGLARQAREEKWAFEDYLQEVLAAEQTSRAESAIKQRIHDARFPEMKTLDSFDFHEAEGIDAKLVADLARGDWVKDAKNVLFVGPIGTGKTHLAIALGIEAARKRRIDEALAKKAEAKPRGRFKELSVEELRAKYVEVVGRPSGSSSKPYLVWKIREAEKGHVPVGPRATRRREGEPTDMRILPLRLEAGVVDKMDDAWRERDIPSRMEFFRRALGHYLKHLGATDAARAFEQEA